MRDHSRKHLLRLTVVALALALPYLLPTYATVLDDFNRSEDSQREKAGEQSLQDILPILRSVSAKQAGSLRCWSRRPFCS